MAGKGSLKLPKGWGSTQQTHNKTFQSGEVEAQTFIEGLFWSVLILLFYFEVFRGSSSCNLFGQFEESQWLIGTPPHQRSFFLQKMDYYRDLQLAKTWDCGLSTPADTSQDNPTPKA